MTTKQLNEMQASVNKMGQLIAESHQASCECHSCLVNDGYPEDHIETTSCECKECKIQKINCWFCEDKGYTAQANGDDDADITKCDCQDENNKI